LPRSEALAPGHPLIAAVTPGDALAIASATCFAISNVTIARGARADAKDNGAFVSLLVTVAIASVGWAGAGLAHGFAPVSAQALLWFSAAGVLTAFVGRVFFYASVQRLGAMRSSTMKRLNPFFAVLLGVLVLGETLTTGMAAGLLLIVASFVALALGAPRPAGAHEPLGRRLLDAGYLYGPVSALGYASGYLLRKMGLAEAHDALLGAAVGCLAGVVLFLVTARFSETYREAVRATFVRPNPWLIGAGVMSSFGQILYFAALNESPMSRVALISSMEVFVTLFLGAVFLRGRERLTVAVVLAAILGVAGTALVIGL
jgi:drug/metabolite transporter (DMT)-like permease